jgi:hypothetical protein
LTLHHGHALHVRDVGHKCGVTRLPTFSWWRIFFLSKMAVETNELNFSSPEQTQSRQKSGKMKYVLVSGGKRANEFQA